MVEQAPEIKCLPSAAPLPRVAETGRWATLTTVDRVYIFVGRYLPGIAALVALLSLLVGGVVLGLRDDPLWANRAGSLIVVVGILLGASRYYERQITSILARIYGDRALFVRSHIGTIEATLGRSITPEERIQVALSTSKALDKKKAIESITRRLVEPDIGRIKIWEILIVIVGTVVNGFGDLLLKWANGSGA
jgi:hypothetical protein